jgi:tetraacyldisaccharide 4'-kinase
LRFLSGLYGRAAQFRRAWYGRHPFHVRRLARPVISVGNLVVGGSGKTPVVATIARLLLAAGEQPVILSRGYGRRRSADGVVVVSDGQCTQVSPKESGDEPQMLARGLAGVPVLVSPDRYLAGRLAERRLGCTVHLLDDGFQHLQLARDINLLVMSKEDLDESPIPSGRLREPLDAARAADALLVGGNEHDAELLASRTGVTPVFQLIARQGEPRLILEDHDVEGGPRSGPAMRPTGRRVVAVAGIARPARFFEALRAGGWEVVREFAFRDHHWFSHRDLAKIERTASDERADLILTTEKDAARLEAEDVADSPISWAAVPLEMSIEPLPALSARRESKGSFMSWLQERLVAARARAEAA